MPDGAPITHYPVELRCPRPARSTYMRFLTPVAALIVSLALLGCRSSPPPSEESPGVHVHAPGVNVDIRTDK